jgi:hypothetical protein
MFFLMVFLIAGIAGASMTERFEGNTLKAASKCGSMKVGR